MNFLNEQKVAIVWFDKSSQQFAISIDKIEASETKSSKKLKNNVFQYSLNMKKFNPLDQTQHFIVHLINPDNFFQDSFLIIESILYPNSFLEIEENTLILGQKQQNATKWQFIDGHLTSEKGKYVLFLDIKNNFSLKICNSNKFNENRSNQLFEINEKTTFHMCFYDGNTIPEKAPITFYSPFFKKVISTSQMTLEMRKYNDHSKSQVWVYNSYENNELSNSAYPFVLMAQDTKQNRLLASSFCDNLQCSIKYKDYKILFNRNSFVNYDEKSGEFSIKSDKNRFKRNIIINYKKNDDEICIDQPSTFIIFLSNQKFLFGNKIMIKDWYLYRHFNRRSIKLYDNTKFHHNDIIIFKKDEKKFENSCSQFNFSYKKNPEISFTLFKTDLKAKFMNYHEEEKQNHIDSRIFITSDPRIKLFDVQLNENSNITFSLKMNIATLFDNNDYNYYKIGHDCMFSVCFNNITDNNNNNDDDLSRSIEYSYQYSENINVNVNQNKNWISKKIYIPDGSSDFNCLSCSINSLIDQLRKLEEEEEEEYNEKELMNYINKKDIPSKINKEFEDLLNGNKITITKKNSSYCKKLGQRLGITGLIDIANVIETFSLQYERLSVLSEIQEMLMTINSSNYKSLMNNFEQKIENYDDSTICWLILSTSLCRPLENDSLARFCKLLLKKRTDEFRKEFKKTIQRSFISPEPNFFFLKKIYDHCKDLFSHDEIKYLLRLKRKNVRGIIFFSKEFPEFFDKNELKEFQKEQESFDEFIETGLNSSALLKMIRNDDIDSFQKIVIDKKLNINREIKNNSLERIPILKNNPSLIQYAAFFGSIKIFKYLLLNGADLKYEDLVKRNCFHYAIAGGNSEIIHIIQHNINNDKFNYSTDMIACAIQYGQNDVFQWIMSNISTKNLQNVIMQYVILTSIISKNINCLLSLIDKLYQVNAACIHYSAILDNLEFLKLFLPFDIEFKESLIFDAAMSGNVEMMKYLMMNSYKYNIRYDNYLRKLALKIAIKFDNSEIFQFLANEKDYYSDKNYFYSVLCESSSILELFSSFDFSQIIVNDNCPFFIFVLKNKLDVWEVLIKSKYFNYQESFNGHSMFYYAVTNKIFDLASTLNSKYPKYFSVNDDEILVNYCKEPEIVDFLISFPELNVNAKNKNHQTSIEILTRSHDINEKEKKSISYLLKRSDININPNELFLFSIRHNDQELFEKIFDYCLKHKVNISSFSNAIINEIEGKKKYSFLVQLIKNKMISVDQKRLIDICIKSQDITLFNNILNVDIPYEMQIQALLLASKNDNYPFFDYLMSLNTLDFKRINDYLPNSNETLLTYVIKTVSNPLFVKKLLLNNKIDVNKPNKSGETPLSITLNKKEKFAMLLISHANIKISYNDLVKEYYKSKKIFIKIVLNVIHFIDDPQLIINFIIDRNDNYMINEILKPSLNTTNDQTYIEQISQNNSDLFYSGDDMISPNNSDFKPSQDYSMREDEMRKEPNEIQPINEEYLKYFERIKKTIFIPTIISFYLKKKEENVLKVFSIIDPDLNDNQMIQEKIKHCLCESIYENIYNDKIKKYYKMFFCNQLKIISDKSTLFSNVRSKEIAKKLMKLLDENNTPIDSIIKEVGGLNIKGKTVFYTSIDENNSILFNYLLKLSDELNSKLSKKEKKLFDYIIYAKNKDGSNPFYAACLKENQKKYLDKLMDKMIKLQNSDYFGKYVPLRAAFATNNLKLVDLLISKGFIIDHYVFCQLLQSKNYGLFNTKYSKAMNNFKFDLFMPLQLIEDENELQKIFTKDMINFSFIPNDDNKDEFDEYLLVSSIRNSNYKLIKLILNSCDRNKIMFHWQDKNGKTALHYAIEKSMSDILYLLIDEYTSTKTKTKWKFTIKQNNKDLVYSENDNFRLFFIEDEDGQTPIHYLFKSLNIDYISYFYNHASSYLKSQNKADYIKTIFNAQILTYEKIDEIRSLNDSVINSNDSNDKHAKIFHKIYVKDDKSDEYLYDLNHSIDYSSDSRELPTYLNEVKPKIVKIEGETLLTFSIMNRNMKFIEFIIEKLPEIDLNKPNKNGHLPVLLAAQNFDFKIFELIIKSSEKTVSNKNSKTAININKDGLVFSIFEMGNNEIINSCFKRLMKCKNFDFNQKKVVQNEIKGTKEKIYLIDMVLKNYSNLDKEIIKMFFESPKLSLNVRSDIAFDLIDKSIGKIVSYSSLFERINDDIIKNARTKDDAKDSIATYAAKNYKNYPSLIALIFDKRVDFIDTKNAEGKNSVDILNENENLDLVSIILNKRK